MDRVQPQAGDPQPSEVVEAADQAPQVAVTVTVGVLEGAHLDAVDHRLLIPPRRHPTATPLVRANQSRGHGAHLGLAARLIGRESVLCWPEDRYSGEQQGTSEWPYAIGVSGSAGVGLGIGSCGMGSGSSTPGRIGSGASGSGRCGVVGSMGDVLIPRSYPREVPPSACDRHGARRIGGASPRAVRREGTVIRHHSLMVEENSVTHTAGSSWRRLEPPMADARVGLRAGPRPRGLARSARRVACTARPPRRRHRTRRPGRRMRQRGQDCAAGQRRGRRVGRRRHQRELHHAAAGRRAHRG